MAERKEHKLGHGMVRGVHRGDLGNNNVIFRGHSRHLLIFPKVTFSTRYFFHKSLPKYFQIHLIHLSFHHKTAFVYFGNLINLYFYGTDI